MKIGIDGRLWNESGVGRYIRNLVQGIDSKKTRDNFVIFLTGETYNKVVFKNPNIKKVKSASHWHTLSEQWRFKNELDREKLDLVHFPYFSYPVFYNQPFVITIHDLIIDHYPTGIASSLPLPLYKLKHYGYKKIIASSIKKSKRIISPSNATKDELQKHYKADADKIEVIYEGFDPSIMKDGKGNLVSGNYILYVGNAYPHKNLERLLSAYRKIRRTNDIDLVCIGRDDFFYRKLEAKKGGGVHFLHNVDDRALFEYYTNAKLFVMPSLMEGFGLPILEAMHLSCPVVSSDTPALKEIGGDACVYFDPEKEDEIFSSIVKVLGDNQLSQSLVQKGRKRSVEFSWAECIEKTLKVYESCDSIRSGE